MNTGNNQMTNSCLTASFWEQAWQEFQRDSILKTTQQIHPGRWRQFYDQVAGLWDQISGIGTEAAEAAVQALDAQHQLAPGMTALEIGCGPGNLTMALAARGVEVTAMDDSPGMLSVLLRRIENQGMRNIEAILSSWKEFQADAPYQMVLAAFFPQAMTAAGIQQMEASAGQTCALVVGTGQETFPFRREIWRKIMTTQLPEINFHLPCAMAYLLTSGRNPNLQHLSWQASLCLSADEVARYFQAYLAIFGKQGPEVRDVIMEVISPYLEDDMLKMEAKASAALIHWHPHDAKSC